MIITVALLIGAFIFGCVSVVVYLNAYNLACDINMLFDKEEKVDTSIFNGTIYYILLVRNCAKLNPNEEISKLTTSLDDYLFKSIKLITIASILFIFATWRL